jgi:hypothetical protein
LFETIDESFNAIALAVNGFVEGTFTTHVTSLGNGEADTPSAQKATNGSATIPFVPCDASGAYLRPTATWSLDCALAHQGFEGCGFVALSGGQEQRDGFALALGSQMDLGAESTATTT